MTGSTLHIRPRGVARPMLALLLAGGLVGCGRGPAPAVTTYKVEGWVLLAGGEPLRGGRVVFVSKDLTAPEAAAEIGDDGGFALTTRGPGDGAAAGEYKVRIEPPSGGPPAPARGRARRLPFPGKYTDEDSSPLAATVRAEENRLEPFRLK